MKPRQKQILTLLKFKDQITKQDAVDHIGGFYYANASKHVGDVLSRMVNNGTLIRIKPGVFKKGQGLKNEKINPNQLSLF